MSGFRAVFCVMAVLTCGVQATGANAQEGKSVEHIAPSGVKHAPADAPAGIERECVGAEGASVCWLKFTDGTRCVVASSSGSGDSALNCHFSTPLERLHRMPKD